MCSTWCRRWSQEEGERFWTWGQEAQDFFLAWHSLLGFCLRKRTAPLIHLYGAGLRRFPFGRKGNLRSSGLAVTLNIADHWVAFRKQSSRCRLPRARVVRDCDAAWLIFSIFHTWICPTSLSRAGRDAQSFRQLMGDGSKLPMTTLPHLLRAFRLCISRAHLSWESKCVLGS